MGEMSDHTLGRLLRGMGSHPPAWRKDQHGSKGITQQDLLYMARETLFKETPQYQRNFVTRKRELSPTGLASPCAPLLIPY